MAPKLTFNSVYRNATNNLKSKSTPPFLFFRRLRSFGRQAGGVWGGGGQADQVRLSPFHTVLSIHGSRNQPVLYDVGGCGVES